MKTLLGKELVSHTLAHFRREQILELHTYFSYLSALLPGQMLGPGSKRSSSSGFLCEFDAQMTCTGISGVQGSWIHSENESTGGF
jgi:hypothetical protein